MSKRNFLVSCAKSIFALATVVMMSMAFSACSKDNKDDELQLKPNVLTINNREVAVKKWYAMRTTKASTKSRYSSITITWKSYAFY